MRPPERRVLPERPLARQFPPGIRSIACFLAESLLEPSHNRRKLRHSDPTDIMGCSKLETIWEEDEEDEETQPVVSP